VKSDLENLDATTVKLTVEVTAEELQPSVDRAYKSIAAQVQVPGFRKGKVPSRIIDQRVGRAAVIEQAVNESMATFYRDAVAEADLRPMGQPEIEVTELPAVADPNGGMTFTAQVEVRPTLELPDLATLELVVDDIEVTDSDVDERLEALRERFGTLVGVDRPAATGDFVVLDLTATIDDEEIDAVSGVSYQIGSGNMLAGLDEALDGLSAGETTTFLSALAGGDRAGEEASVTVTATSVKTRDLPEADDDFAQLASEFDTIAELREDLFGQVAKAKESNRAIQARDLLLAKFTEEIEVPVPTGLVQAEVHRHLENEGRLDDEDHRVEATTEATEAVTQQILLDTLAEFLEVKVAENELIDYLVNASQQYGMEPQEFVNVIQEQGQIPAMVGEVARSKAIAVALRRVTVLDGAGNTVDLTPYIGADEPEVPAADVVESDEGATAAEPDKDSTEA
jgi:trigger factor